MRLPLPYNFSSQIAQKKAEQQKSALRRAKIEDKIRVEVTRSFAEMRFWQEEALERQTPYQNISALFAKAQKSGAKQGLAPLEAAEAFIQTAYDYLDALRQNLIAKAELEWAVGQDL